MVIPSEICYNMYKSGGVRGVSFYLIPESNKLEVNTNGK